VVCMDLEERRGGEVRVVQAHELADDVREACGDDEDRNALVDAAPQRLERARPRKRVGAAHGLGDVPLLHLVL
jgi:hypothetical protein